MDFSKARLTGAKDVYARATGSMTHNAFDEFRGELPALLRSLIRSLSFDEPAFRPFCLLTIGMLRDNRAFLRGWLDAYYSDPPSKDSFDRRIHNAIHLLIESDGQRHDAIGLALSVTAIEALIGRKGAEISSSIADGIAVLLEPELKHRGVAVQFVKDLYDARSRILHGEKLDSSESLRVDARDLAGAVLMAVSSRKEYMRRIGRAPETPEAFLAELLKMKFRPDSDTGMTQARARQLWA